MRFLLSRHSRISGPQLLAAVFCHYRPASFSSSSPSLSFPLPLHHPASTTTSLILSARYIPLLSRYFPIFNSSSPSPMTSIKRPNLPLLYTHEKVTTATLKYISLSACRMPSYMHIRRFVVLDSGGEPVPRSEGASEPAAHAVDIRNIVEAAGPVGEQCFILESWPSAGLS